ncbi:C4-dicarboxylate transport transcriptional regulatory protein DctD [Stigmatella aurantiaca DW4/3-1]|uniref:C4-dicarboxylate transport transcriptional regulatory protein DctD n=2 Tax=Stigmatella aurantiaca TaxID=41 RepID=Q095Y8_STIAD|nr:C4-dicarboxylate transport transcriptional regulatory protein DctD [Stigmatella aurantiaca DW4/3-1]
MNEKNKTSDPFGSDSTTTATRSSLSVTQNAIQVPAPPLRSAGAPHPVSESRREPKAIRVQREGIDDLIVPLYPDRSYVFGRAPESTVVFPFDSVSRQHGRLAFREDHQWVYRDLNSKNGSFKEQAAAQAEGDARAPLTQMGPSHDWVLEAGDVILLGNGESRLSLLSEVPHGLIAGPRPSKVSSLASENLEQSINICARHSLPVFLLGDSGTGKTFIAREIHSRSQSEGNFVILNCGRLPQESASLTSELLGHVKGAFTGAAIARVGKFFSANGGTLFLDEVEFLPRIAQDFLIDVLEGTGSLAPLGAPADFRGAPPRFRLISASKVPLQESELRPDLAQRLATGDIIIIPTLEERREDIPNLVQSFIHRLKAEQQYDSELTSDAIDFLQKENWPGQIRELETTVRAVVAREAARQDLEGIKRQKIVVTLGAVKSYLTQRQIVFRRTSVTPPPVNPAGADMPDPLRKRPGDLTEQEIRRSLKTHQGNKTRAAAELGIAVNTLKSRMKAFGIDP